MSEIENIPENGEGSLTKPSTYVEPPKKATIAGKKFYEEAQKTISLFFFIIDLAIHTDYSSFIAKEVLEGREYPNNLSPGDLADQEPGPRTRYLRKQKQTLLGMFLCRLVDNFTTYLSEIIRDALRQKPEMLRSREEVRLEYVLRFNSIDELRNDLIERKVSDLGYLGFVALEEWCQKRMGISLLSDLRKKQDVVEILETRNAIIHNRGKVGPKYLRTVTSSQFELNKYRTLDVDYVLNAYSLLLSSVFFLIRPSRKSLTSHTKIFRRRCRQRMRYRTTRFNYPI